MFSTPARLPDTVGMVLTGVWRIAQHCGRVYETAAVMACCKAPAVRAKPSICQTSCWQSEPTSLMRLFLVMPIVVVIMIEMDSVPILQVKQESVSARQSVIHQCMQQHARQMRMGYQPVVHAASLHVNNT